MKRKLLVISNHSPEKWGNEQKRGWEGIEYIPFPNIPAEAGIGEVIDIAIPLCQKIGEWLRNNPTGKVNLQGESSLCCVVYRSIDDITFIFPTTARVAKEKIHPDGRVEKVTTFQFVRWR